MPEILRSEDQVVDRVEKPQEKDQKAKKGPKIDENKLTKTEVKQLKDGKTTVPKLAQERMQLKAAAETELNQMVAATREKGNVIDLKEYKDIKRELDETESPEKTKQILEKIRDLPRQKELAKAKEKEDEKELELDDPKLKKIQQQFDRICDENKELIGEGQVDGFKAWFKEQMAKTPTVKALKTIIQKLEGKEVFDKNGLSPRRKEFEALQGLFRKYDLGSPLENKFIKEEGLSERQEFRKGIEDMEDHFRKVKDTPFYSQKMIRDRMRENLMAENPAELRRRLTQAKEIARKESEGFTHLDATMTIGGVTIRKMSEASKKKYLDYYKNTDFKERAKLVDNWRSLVEHEAKLANDLAEIYKDNPEALKLALGSFGELDFVEKEKALKDHKKLVETTKDKEELERKLTIQAAHAKLDAAARKKIIASGNGNTLDKYKKFFEDPNNFKNPNTKKPGDVGELKKTYQLLINPSPNFERKNLAAYETRRTKFEKDLKKLAEINPALTEEELKKWQERYDKEGWTKRAKIAEDELPKEIAKQKEEQQKKRAEEKEMGITDSEKREAKERSPQRTKLELGINECLAENTIESINEGRKALRLYLVANPEEENDKVLLYLEEQLAKLAREIGKRKTEQKGEEEIVEKEVKNIVKTDEAIRDKLTEEQIRHLNIHGAELSEQRHDQKISAHERALKESLERTQGGSIEEELTRDAYAQMGDDYILNKKGTGEEIQEIDFKEVAMTDQERQNLKERTYREQGKLDTKEGFANVSMKDKSGRDISAEEAEKLQDQDLQALETEIGEKALDKAEKKGAKVFDLSARIAAQRKAREIIEKQKHEKLRAA